MSTIRFPKGLVTSTPEPMAPAIWLVYQKNFSGPGLISNFLNSFSLNLRNPAWNADTDPGLTENSVSHCLCYKIFQHFFCNIKVSDHSLTYRADHFHIRGHMACHLTGLFPYGSDLFCIFIINNYRRFLKNKSLCRRIHQTVSGAQIDSDITCRHNALLSDQTLSLT